MTETIEPMTAQIDQQQLAEELVDKARAEGMELVGQGGLLTGLMKSVFETASSMRRIEADHGQLKSRLRPMRG